MTVYRVRTYNYRVAITLKLKTSYFVVENALYFYVEKVIIFKTYKNKKVNNLPRNVFRNLQYFPRSAFNISVTDDTETNYLYVKCRLLQ